VHARDQRAACDAEQARGLGLVAARAFERVDHDLPL
jgi:hypothetical protein